MRPRIIIQSAKFYINSSVEFERLSCRDGIYKSKREPHPFDKITFYLRIDYSINDKSIIFSNAYIPVKRPITILKTNNSLTGCIFEETGKMRISRAVRDSVKSLLNKYWTEEFSLNFCEMFIETVSPKNKQSIVNILNKLS